MMRPLTGNHTNKYLPWPMIWALVFSILLHAGLLVSARTEIRYERPHTIINATVQSTSAQRSDIQDQRGDKGSSAIADTPKAQDASLVSAPASAVSANTPAAETAKPPTVQTNDTNLAPNAATTNQPRAAKAARLSDQEPQLEPRAPSALESLTKAITPAQSMQSQNTPTQLKPSEKAGNANPALAASNSASLKIRGDDDVITDPVEKAYYKELMAHLMRKLPAHPPGIVGDVRLQLEINYSQVITGVEIIISSGDKHTDEWARRAALSVSPVPPVPKSLLQPYYFRPTIKLTD